MGGYVCGCVYIYIYKTLKTPLAAVSTQFVLQ